MSGRVAAAFCTLLAALTVGVATASADPAPPCGSPEVPCAGPGPLTPEQKCALTAAKFWVPCNWLGQQVPEGTPGSL